MSPQTPNTPKDPTTPPTPIFSDSDALFAVQEGPLGAMVASHVAHMHGKDGGWRVEVEADHSWIVERRFTERRGVSFFPHTWAFRVSVTHAPEGDMYVCDISAANDTARPIVDEFYGETPGASGLTR